MGLTYKFTLEGKVARVNTGVVECTHELASEAQWRAVHLQAEQGIVLTSKARVSTIFLFKLTTPNFSSLFCDTQIGDKEKFWECMPHSVPQISCHNSGFCLYMPKGWGRGYVIAIFVIHQNTMFHHPILIQDVHCIVLVTFERWSRCDISCAAGALATLLVILSRENSFFTDPCIGAATILCYSRPICCHCLKSQFQRTLQTFFCWSWLAARLSTTPRCPSFPRHDLFLYDVFFSDDLLCLLISMISAFSKSNVRGDITSRPLSVWSTWILLLYSLVCTVSGNLWREHVPGRESFLFSLMFSFV